MTFKQIKNYYRRDGVSLIILHLYRGQTVEVDSALYRRDGGAGYWEVLPDKGVMKCHNALLSMVESSLPRNNVKVTKWPIWSIESVPLGGSGQRKIPVTLGSSEMESGPQEVFHTCARVLGAGIQS